jgi:hypothetical protein
MRSTFVKAALAAFLISTPLATAFAASSHEGHARDTHASRSERHELAKTASGDEPNFGPPLCTYRGVDCNPLGY